MKPVIIPKIIFTETEIKKAKSEAKEQLKHKEMQKRFEELLHESLKIAVPKAMYRELHIDKIKEDTIIFGDIVFESKVMRSNLQNIGRVIGYVITCGTELDTWSEQYDDDPLDRFISGSVKQLILRAAVMKIFEDIKNKFGFQKTATMNPGSLPDWPITEQKKLLSMIGNVQDEIGVKLTESNLLIPMKSVSGILFPTEIDYVNCKLCTKKNCPGRQATFDAVMYREKLGKAKK